MLSVHDRKRRREGLGVEEALCKALGWFFPLMAKFGVVSVEELLFRKYPYVCPYCRHCPHKDAICKSTKGVAQTLDHHALGEIRRSNDIRRPKRLNVWQQMFDDIYPRDAATLGSGRSTIGLLEELGELAEAVRVFQKFPKYFAGEAADVFSYLMGIANEHEIKLTMEDGQTFDFETQFLVRYPGMCIQCGHRICVCPSIPEATVGRLAKELDIPPSERLFGLDPVLAEERGKHVSESVLQDLGGISAINLQLPLDRGEANQALVQLCLKLSQELILRSPSLSAALREAALRMAADSRGPGSKDQGSASGSVLILLSQVWPLLNLAAIPDDHSLPSRLGSLLRAQSVRIGVVTALPKEFAAMRIMLDEEVPIAVAGDPNNYVLGRIPTATGADHLVVVTLLKEMGNNSAASAATNLLRSFPRVEDILMVGIAGGIPSPDSPDTHVRLGDVVVSNKEGVLQYDNLKLGLQRIKIRSNTSKPSSRMIGAVNVLESGRFMRNYPWEEYLARASKLEASDRPHESSDVLFDPKKNRRAKVIQPGQLSRRQGLPMIHFGRIGASNVLLRNSVLRDLLRDEHSVLAIEMEGSGIADAAWNLGQQYLIIRGICDYCDETKSDLWQGYAAIAAAAYARTVVSSVNPQSYQG